MGVRVQRGGEGGPVLVLLHGLGATSEVWDDWKQVLARRWPGQWIAPDLPGHGRSSPLPSYSFDSLADALAVVVPIDEPVVVLGHSLGGVLGLALADQSRGYDVQAVVGLGVKVSWSEEELARARALAERPVAWFETREDAVERHLRVSGLCGLIAADHPAARSGVREEAGRWRLALDPATFGVGAPDMSSLLARTASGVVLARGEHDPMNTTEAYAALVPEAVTLAGLGHNAHLEDPATVLAVLDTHLVL
jgi:pimeloyl-ACP methyl ester carboxylesterase